MISISKLGDTYGVMTMVALPMKPQMHPYKQDLQSMCLDIVQEPYTACAAPPAPPGIKVDENVLL